MNTREKFFKRFKKSRLHVDKEVYRKAKYNTFKLITTKIQAFFDDKLRIYWKTKRTMGNLKISRHAKVNNLSITSRMFSNDCKVAKLKPIFKKKTKP